MTDVRTGVYTYAQEHFGTKVGDGECWTLANEAVRSAGGRPPASASLYNWGTTIELGQLARGDVVQFSRYTVRITQSDGAWQELTRGAPRHTAIVETVRPNGEVVVLEANVDASKNVRRTTLYFQSGTVGEAEVAVSGSFTFYQVRAATP